MASDRTPSGTPEDTFVVGTSDIDWTSPHRLDRLEQLCGDVVAPWSLVPSSRTCSGTIVLHDANGVAIADLYTVGPATPVDRLIALAPTAIAQLIAELRCVRERLSLVARREAQLHYAIRRDANIIDHKLTEEEAHKVALDKAERMQVELDALHCTAGSGHRG